MLAVERLIRPFQRGSTLPWLARASDGKDYVVKFAGAGPGERALLAEYLVGRIAFTWGLPVPSCAPIFLSAEVPRVGTDEFWDVLDASRGWNLAIRYVSDASEVPADPSALPAATLRAIAWLDAAFANCDRTEMNSNLIADSRGQIWLIDHGSCLIVSRLEAGQAAFDLPPNHFLRGADTRAILAQGELPGVDTPDSLDAVIAEVPEAWLAHIALSRQELGRRLAQRMRAFRSWVGG